MGAQLDLDFSPARVVCFVAWPISQNILISQLHGDFFGGIGKLIEILYCKEAATRHLRNLREEGWPVELLGRSATVFQGIKDADGVELGIRFPYETLQVALAVATVIIASIGQNEQRSPADVCPAHLAEPQIDGVQERGAAFGRSQHHLALKGLQCCS